MKGDAAGIRRGAERKCSSMLPTAVQPVLSGVLPLLVPMCGPWRLHSAQMVVLSVRLSRLPPLLMLCLWLCLGCADRSRNSYIAGAWSDGVGHLNVLASNSIEGRNSYIAYCIGFP